MRSLIIFNRKKRPDKGSVEIQVYLNRTQRVYFATGVIIEPKFWDKTNKLVRHTHPEFSILSAKISSLKKKIDDIIFNHIVEGKTITVVELRSIIENSNTSKSFNEYLLNQIEIDKPIYKPGTFRRVKGVVNDFNQFKDVLFSQIDIQLIREYHNHLLETMKPSSTSKNHNVIRKYLNRALNEGLIKTTPYSTFKIPADISRTVFLTEIELNSLRNKKIEIQRLEVVRDLFLFLCNTGMEFTDLDNLKAQDIITIGERRYIVKNRIKQDQETQAIPLLKEAENLIDKYKDVETGRIFPKRSNQRFNAYLKELATICNINKELSTIVARHTFATRMLTEGLPIETVSHILGHSNVRTTKKHYAKLIVTKIENDLNRLNIVSL